MLISRLSVIKFALFTLFAASALAATTSVQDTLYNASHSPANGSLSISWPSFTAGDGSVVPGSAGPLIVVITNGVLNVALEPTDAATPSGVCYTVIYSLVSAYYPPECWAVPTSGSPVNLATVRTNPPPAITYSTLPAASLTGHVPVTLGGTNVGTLTAHGVLIGEGTSSVVVSAAGTSGYCFTANGASSDPTWQVCGGGGGGGATSVSQLLDFLYVKTSGTVETLGGNCAAGAPCLLRINSVLFRLTTSPTLTLSGSSATGTVYTYFTSAGVLTAGHNSIATITGASGITVVTGVTGFPADSIPLWATTFTANVWDTLTEAMDYRAAFATSITAAGSGISVTYNGSTGVETVATDSTIVPQYFTGSGAPGSNCTAGRDYYTDTTNANTYNCTSTNTWSKINGTGAIPAGGDDFLFGTPSYTNSGSGHLVSPAGNANGGMIFAFVAKVPSSSKINYKVTTAQSSTGILFGIYSSNLATAVCVSSVGTGANVSSTGAKSLTWASGSGVSGGVCTLTLGTQYRFLATTDGNSLAIETYGDAHHFAVANVNHADIAGYDANGVLSTGSAGSVAFATVSGVTFTALSDGGANYQPVIFLEQ